MELFYLLKQSLLHGLIRAAYFPIWLYTDVVQIVFHRIKQQWHIISRGWSLRAIWGLLLTPMYGQTDLWGRLISLLIRFGWAMILSVGALLYSALSIVFMLIVICLLPLLLWAVIYRLSHW